MAQFLFVYHGGKAPETDEAAAASMAAWGKWMSENSDAFADPGNPVGKSKTVSGDGIVDHGGANPAAGYTIVKAADIDAACEIARTNPMIADGGSIEVAEIHEVEL